MAKIRGVLFDKDGTLFDFHATWAPWAAQLLLDLGDGDADRAADLGARVGFDFRARAFTPGSRVIAGTPDEVAALLHSMVPHLGHGALTQKLNALAADAPQVEAVPLVPFIAGLRARGLALGVATNDAEAPARVHLDGAGIGAAFDFVAGYDSGHGAKPGPGMAHAFCAATGLAPAQVVMVGDSTHDLHCARAAGMAALGVLTGPAARPELEPLADAVIDSIAGLEAWLDGR